MYTVHMRAAQTTTVVVVSLPDLQHACTSQTYARALNVQLPVLCACTRTYQHMPHMFVEICSPTKVSASTHTCTHVQTRADMHTHTRGCVYDASAPAYRSHAGRHTAPRTHPHTGSTDCGRIRITAKGRDARHVFALGAVRRVPV
ncbi:unnamed protein product [Brugia pahangi]|uniref:Secreted protein n=1 Tax=Brugia pahangi TaxID=6280 RepID=A0A0N4SZ65_BRUPA|nr:unnamed protein product [Brugia pahangi]